MHTFVSNILSIVGGATTSAFDKSHFRNCLGQFPCPDNEDCDVYCKNNHYFRGGKCVANQYCCRHAIQLSQMSICKHSFNDRHKNKLKK